MELSELYGLMDRFSRSGLTSLRWRKKDEEIELSQQPAASAAVPVLPQNQGPEDTGKYIKSPLVGTFYQAPGPEEAPFVTVGQTVKKGQTLCIIEAMKMMSQIPAEADCVIEEVLVSDGEAVGYGTPLFRLREAASC